MDQDSQQTQQDSDLRRRAEERLQEKGLQSHNTMSEHETRALLYELQVHQIELEMQNEELKRARLQADALKEQYLDLYNFSPVGYFTFDKNGTILSANLTAAKLLEIDRNSLIGRRFQLFIDADSRNTFTECVKEIIGTGEKRSFEVNILRDGKVSLCLHMEGVALQSTEREERLCRVAAVDITAHKRTEAELRQRAEDMRVLMDVAPVAIWIGHDPYCNKITGNRVANQYYNAELGENLSASVTPNRRFFREGRELAPEELPMQYAAAHNVEVQNTEFEVLTSTGTCRTLLGQAIPLRDVNGAVRGVVGAFVDITERKQAEQASQAAKELLQYQVNLLQRALIPNKPPRIEGYSVASAYIPAHEGTEIGGDFLDVFMTEDSKVGILIGDVSGKGIESAALAAITRSTVRAFAYDSSSPGDVLFHANSLLSVHQVDYMQFVTSFLAILDPATGELSYSSAGHPPAIVSRENGDTESLYTHNIPLGVFGGAGYEEGKYILKSGDRLVLYTDGITEARHDHSLFGTEGVESILSMYRHADPDELVEQILNAVKDWAHGKLRDDTAVLIIGRYM